MADSEILPLDKIWSLNDFASEVLNKHAFKIWRKKKEVNFLIIVAL